MVVDVTAIEIATNDKGYRISLQGSSNADFSDTIEELAGVELGAAEVLNGDQDNTVGRYIVPVRTERNGTVWPYVRVYTEVAGTIASGINCTALLEK